jgi:hypothetical protein
MILEHFSLVKNMNSNTPKGNGMNQNITLSEKELRQICRALLSAECDAKLSAISAQDANENNGNEDDDIWWAVADSLKDLRKKIESKCVVGY